MIKTKSDLRDYIAADYARQEMRHSLLAKLTFGEHNRTRRYLRCLRYLEYHLNNKEIWYHKPLYLICLIKHRYLSLKFGMFIMPNTTGKGLLIPHPGYIRVDSFSHLGDNCTILPMVLLGKRRPHTECRIEIGENCYIGVGVTILGPIIIGNNVTIAAGAVVNKNIPDYAVVAGVPARIVKFEEEK